MDNSIKRQNSTKNYLNQLCNYKNSIFRPRYYPIDGYNSCPCPGGGGKDEDILIIYDGGPVGGWKK